MRKVLLGALLGTAVFVGSGFAADIIVKERPPAPLLDERGRPPSKGHVWIAGYHKWDGKAYVWVPGRWEMPPRPHARYEAAHWRHDHDGYVFVEGRWK